MNSIFIVSFSGNATPATIKQLASINHEQGVKWLVSKVNFIENQVAAVIKGLQSLNLSSQYAYK